MCGQHSCPFSIICLRSTPAVDIRIQERVLLYTHQLGLDWALWHVDFY